MAHALCLPVLLICTVLATLPSPRFAGASAPPTTLIYGGTQEPDTLNPLLSLTPAAQAVESAVFDSLLRVDANNRMQPSLAQSWQHSADGRTWTFHLRRDVKFADGVDLTSTDVYWTYLSVLNPHNQAATTQGWDEVDTMTTPDRFTVVIHLKRLLAPWLELVGTTAILPKHALYMHPNLLNLPFNRTPFGSGPYLVSTWQAGNHITLTANPYYWGGRPALRTIVYRFLPDDAQLLQAMQRGTVQMGNVNPVQVSAAQRIPRRRLTEVPGMTWYHIDLKQWGFLRELAVRQALDFATPKAALVHDILRGHGQVAQADVAPALTSFFNPHVAGHPYDPLRAAELLAADGFTPGPGNVLQRCVQHAGCTALRLTLWSVTGDYFGQQVNTRLAAAWGAIGVGVTLRTGSAAYVFGSTGPQFSRVMTGITYGWTNTDDPDDRFYWNSAYIPASPIAGGGNDVAYFYRFSFQSEIDLLTDTGVLQTDQTKRRLLYMQIQQVLADQVPVIFLYWQNVITLVPSTLAGYQPTSFAPPFWDVAQWHWS